MYAVVESGNKQYRVSEGDVVRVESLPGAVGDAVVFDRVLLVSDGNAARLGTPLLDGVQVRGSIVSQGRGLKIRIYTYKKRLNSNRRRAGHRQAYTAVKIDSIEA